MKDGRKARARSMARVDALEQVADSLRRSWLALDQHRGLEDLAPPIEEALDAVEERLEKETREPRRESGREAGQEPSERLVQGSGGEGP